MFDLEECHLLDINNLSSAVYISSVQTRTPSIMVKLGLFDLESDKLRFLDAPA